MADPIFNLKYSIATVTRVNVEKSKIVDALKDNSGAPSFTNNVIVNSGFTCRWGEWLAPDADGKWGYAAGTDAISMPLWQDPSLRYDHEGGVTLLQGVWTAETNVINRSSLAVNDDLVVGALPGNHSVLPSGNGLVRRAGLAGGTQWMVVAHVEEILADVVKITNVNAGYFRAGG